MLILLFAGMEKSFPAFSMLQSLAIFPCKELSELLYETFSDYSNISNKNGSPLTYGDILDTLSSKYNGLEEAKR